MQRDNNLREWRLVNGMTLKDLAKRTGLDYRYLSQLEKGLRKGTPNTWIKIANELKVPAKAFFPDEVKEAGAKYSCFG
ncbi:MAG TPA: helix-turn-helix transcriptional regulator [Desulfitobacterium dehalogenans]|uniref:Helix-turn-helix transcriptional regulator n=1 Tax=Desulfitobacterium dehalogenans TaxID=36854 RepID=A0A7C7D8Z5_9FIRM|nr:helix-turn-helix transcriptional regulator [Desulfitobacterium dehalogenans]